MLKSLSRPLRLAVAFGILASRLNLAASQPPHSHTPIPPYSLTAAPISPTPPAPAEVVSPLDQAISLLDDGHDDQAAEALKNLVEKEGRASETGRAASALLITAYRSLGRFEDALTECNQLLNSFPAPPAGTSAPGPAASNVPTAGATREEIAALRDVLQSQAARDQALQARIAAATAPVLRSIARADASSYRGRASEALQDYSAAYHAAADQPAISQETRLLIESRYLSALMARPLDERLALMPEVAFPMLENTAASVPRRIMGLRFLKGLADQDPAGWISVRLEKDLRAIVNSPVSPTSSSPAQTLGAPSLSSLAQAALSSLQKSTGAHPAPTSAPRPLFLLAVSTLRDLRASRAARELPLRQLAQATLNQMQTQPWGPLRAALASETNGDWAGALASYQAAAKASAANPGHSAPELVRRVFQQANRSIPWMQALVRQSD